ncbi:MAG: hypothetical protein AAFY39_03600 [Pseudomonadota bacterium]
MQDTSITREDVARSAHIGFIAFIIACLYLFLVWLLIISFSAYVIRSDWDMVLNQQATEEGVKSFDDLVFLIDRDSEIDALLLSTEAELREIENGILDHTTEDVELGERKKRVDGQFESYLRIVRAHLSAAAFDLIDTQKARMVTLIGSEGLTETTAITGLTLLEKAEYKKIVSDTRQDAIRSETERLQNQLNELYEMRSTLLRDVALLEANKTWAIARRTDAETLRNEHLAAREDVRTKLPVYSEHRGRLKALEGVNADGGILFASNTERRRVMGQLVRWPPILLTLMATIAAGALGTLVAYTRTRFVGTMEPKVSELTISIGEGIAAAIGVFLFAGAGLLSLSQGNGGSETLDLSPYMVAFLAFLSGLMAESAFGKITGYGKVLFRVDE